MLEGKEVVKGQKTNNSLTRGERREGKRGEESGQGKKVKSIMTEGTRVDRKVERLVTG